MSTYVSYIFLIIETEDHAIEILFNVFFHKVKQVFEKGSPCSKLVKKFKIFDHCIKFLQEYM